jgi:arylsulfatase A-like enzyme
MGSLLFAKNKLVRSCTLVLPLAAMIVLPLPIARNMAVKATFAQNSRPNILIIMTDDQSHDTLTDQFMPFTKSMIADQGINFSNGFMSTAICCPSRASFLTGKYARNHGVHLNSDTLDQTTVADRLQAAGYYTGLIGKYLNSWPGDARSEYNYWACWEHGYENPEMNIFGENKTVNGYLTYLLRDYALDFLNKVPSNHPFFLLWTPHAPHKSPTPAPGDENLYSDLPAWRPPSFNPAHQSDKPKWLADTPKLTPNEIAKDDVFRLKQLRTLHSVDLAVRDILKKLQDQGKLDNTFVVFYSDNGLFWGEHRLLHKNRAYEEATHVPFAIRFPPLVAAPRIEDKLIQVIDLAPTIYDLAGIPIPGDVDGRSLVPLMRGTSEWRDGLLLEGWPEDTGKDAEDFDTSAQANLSAEAKQSEHYQAIRTDQYLYVQTDNDLPELYDLKADPYQMTNLVNDSRYKKQVKKLRKRLKKGNFF